jgi:fibronectin type 3 domain-containing protein
MKMKHRLLLRLLAIVLLASALLTTAAAATFAAAPDPAPPFPTNIRASDGTYSYMVKVTWNASPGATDYRIFRANSLDGNRTSIANAATTYYDDYSAWGGLQVHYYWVIACVNGVNCSGGGNDFGTPDSGFRGLATPDVSASDGTYSDKIRITWSSIQAAESYTLYRGTSEAGYTTVLSNLTTTSYEDTNALRGTVYYYWIKAVAAIDESSLGGPDSGYRNYAAPTGVAATDGTYIDKVRVTWFGSANATRYQVWREPAAGGSAQKLGSLASPPFDDATAVPGTSYRYTITACNTDESICSQPSAADGGYRALTAPTGLAASDGTYTDKVRVGWNANPNATSYTLRRGVSPGTYLTTFSDILTNSYDDGTALPGVPYYYAVSACGAAGCSNSSAADEGYAALAAPTGIQASDGAYPNKVHVTWNTATGATFYTVLRATSPTGTRTEVATPTGAAYDDLSAVLGTVYHYWVKACTASMCSALSGSDSGYRSSLTSTPTATATGKPTATPTATPTGKPGATPTATSTRPPGVRLRTYLPLVLK